MEEWEYILSKGITSPENLPNFKGIDTAGIQKVISSYPMFINPYFLGLIKHKGDEIYRQAVPDLREITEEDGFEDPLNEEGLSPIPGLTHKYPDRVLLLVSNRCAMYCRFCNRKRKVGKSTMVTGETLREGIAYIRGNTKIRALSLKWVWIFLAPLGSKSSRTSNP